MIPQTKTFANAQLAAIGVGAAVCSAQFLLVTGGLTGAGASLWTVVWFGLFVFMVTWLVAAIGFGLGLLLIGIPVWAALIKLGWMSEGVATAAGAVLAALAGGLLGSLASGLGSALQPAVFMLLPGAAAGWTLHRVAYGGRKPA
jgi:hypothetical protein